MTIFNRMTDMKNIKTLILLSALALSSVACSLDEVNYVEMQKEKYMNNSAEVESVLLGVYRNMAQDGTYGYHLSCLFTIPTDQAKVEGSSTDSWRIIPSNAYGSTQAEVEQTWQALYNGVYDANDFIEALASKLDNFEGDERNACVIYMGEAHALRALYYFELLRWYGHISLITATSQSNEHPSTFTQAEPEEVFALIESDLKYAIDVLPYNSDNTLTDTQYRFSKGAALGLLTKVYATWAGYPVHDESKWQEAVNTARILVGSGKHHLLESNGEVSGFEQLWYNTCSSVWDPAESLIEVSFYAPVASGSGDPVGRIGKWNGVKADGIESIRNAGNWKVLPSFVKNWKDSQNDRRWALSFADYTYKSGVKSPISEKYTLAEALSDDAPDEAKRAYVNNMCPAKWDTEKYVSDNNVLIEQNMSNINWYILRYADVLLLYAEALNEVNNGPTAEAYEAVNMVRRRGYGLPVGTASSVADLEKGMTYEEFRQAVRDERSYELAFEGHRRQDLIRWGIYYETLMDAVSDMAAWYADSGNYLVFARYTQKGKHELLPIPNREMLLMKQYEQNPYW